MATVIDTLTWAGQSHDAYGKANGTIVDLRSTTDNSEPNLRFVVTRSGIDVRLTNKSMITALRFEIEFESRFRYRPPELHARIQGLNSYINFQDNILAFVLLGMNGNGIQAGNGTIASIPLDEDLNFNIVSAYASTGIGSISEIQHSISNDDSDGQSLVLEQNDPNPFASKTRIDFTTSDETDAKLLIYDVGGALVRTLLDAILQPGTYQIEWDGSDDSGRTLESGVYFYKLYAGVYSITRKMVFLSEGASPK